MNLETRVVEIVVGSGDKPGGHAEPGGHGQPDGKSQQEEAGESRRKQEEVMEASETGTERAVDY